ncbi:hypothetical protein, partial [Dactylosporangium sucinum]|uniref:hypothetical protein n=2 Tax=Dactylosporangium sucinum TaxID=1424081 RepID=UPI00167DD2BC
DASPRPPPTADAHTDGLAEDKDRRYRRDLVQRHLAVRARPAGPDAGDDRLTAHPDLTFGLRLTNLPAPPELGPWG